MSLGPRARPWVIRMRWRDLLFAHWGFDPRVVRHLVPASLELDLFDGRAYVGVVPFRMEDVGIRGLPAPPVVGAFPELNVRTYVTQSGQPGVWFLSLDASERLAVIGARRFFHLPYVWADMHVEATPDGVSYVSTRRNGESPAATFRAHYGPSGPIAPAIAGSFEAWATDRSRLFATDAHGRIERTEVRHRPWPLQPAWADIDAASMLRAHGLESPDQEPRLAFSRRLDVRAWWPRPA